MKFRKPQILERFVISFEAAKNSRVDLSGLVGGIMIMYKSDIPSDWNVDIYDDEFLLVTTGAESYTDAAREVAIAALEWCHVNYAGCLDDLADGEKEYLIKRFGQEAYDDYIRQYENM